jgi:hypothetical protein
MAAGPYRQIDVVETRSPPGITFFADRERLSVEVKRWLPLVATGAALIGAGITVAVTRHWSHLLGEAVLFGNAGYWCWPRLRRASRLTSLEIRGGAARFVQVGVVGRDERTIPLDRLGLPTIAEIVIERSESSEVRLRCLQFDDYVDCVRGGQSLPLQILVGYRLRRLEWLRENIGSWMRSHEGIAGRPIIKR